MQGRRARPGAVTTIADRHVPADIEAVAWERFDADTYAALVFTIVTINAWNRLAIAGHSEPGHYRPRATASALTAD